MLTELALGTFFFPALFSLSRRCLERLPLAGWGEADAVIVSSRLVSLVQAVMASCAGLTIVMSCRGNILESRHWLANTYVLFAVPYFAYDIYAMYLCHWHKRRVKGHEIVMRRSAVLRSYFRKDLLMIIHHSFMFLVCFPVSVFLREGRGDYFVGCLFMAEVSTPFVCLGKILIQYRAGPLGRPRRCPCRRRPLPLAPRGPDARGGITETPTSSGSSKPTGGSTRPPTCPRTPWTR